MVGTRRVQCRCCNSQRMSLNGCSAMKHARTLLILLACTLAGCDPARPLGSKERGLFPPAVACPTADGHGYRVLLNGMILSESWAIRNQPLIEDWLDIEELIPDVTRREILRERIRPLV